MLRLVICTVKILVLKHACCAYSDMVASEFLFLIVLNRLVVLLADLAYCHLHLLADNEYRSKTCQPQSTTSGVC